MIQRKQSGERVFTGTAQATSSRQKHCARRRKNILLFSLPLSVNRSSLSLFCEVVENICALAIIVLSASAVYSSKVYKLYTAEAVRTKPEFVKLALY
jgi:hypothetical protein